MAERLFQSATPDFAKDFTKTPLRARHRFAETGMFDDAGLARLIEDHPADLTDIHAPRGVARDTADFPVIQRGQDSGADILERVRAGKLWINLRLAMNLQDGYRQMYAGVMDELRAASPHFRPRNMTAGVLISSPGASVPYHCDKIDVVLWHIRGRKRVFVYPPEEPFLKGEEYENRINQAANDDLSYDPAFEAGAKTYDLEPGDMLCWPLHSPHRVENLDGLNVSITMEWSSWRSAIRNGAYAANGAIRRHTGRAPIDPRQAPAALNTAKFLMHRAVKTVAPGLVQPAGYQPDARLTGGMDGANGFRHENLDADPSAFFGGPVAR